SKLACSSLASLIAWGGLYLGDVQRQVIVPAGKIMRQRAWTEEECPVRDRVDVRSWYPLRRESHRRDWNSHRAVTKNVWFRRQRNGRSNAAGSPEHWVAANKYGFQPCL